jgi:hypothetical protein
VDALKRWRKTETVQQSRYSKGIYITPPTRDGKYQPWGRLRIWVEGFEPDLVKIWIDGKLVNTYRVPPYVLTSEGRSDDNAIPSGRHLLKVRAEQGEEWLEQVFEVTFA